MLFQARALDAQQRLVEVSLDALDEGAARAQLRRQGLAPVKLQVRSTGASTRRSAFPLVLFAQEMHALLVAGLSVVEALEALAEKEASAPVRSVLARLVERLREGLRLSDALREQSQVFPPLFIGIVQAAEGTSELPRSLSRYVDYENRLNTVRQKVISSAIYPTVLLGVGGAVAMFLMGYVVPRFAQVYQSSGRTLPWTTQLLLDWGSFAQTHAGPLAFTAFALLGLLAWGVVRQWRQGMLWQWLAVLPGARPKLELLILSRLYMTLGMLLEGGLPITSALRITRSVLPPARQPAIAGVLQQIEQGESLSQALITGGLVTPVALRLLRVGERSGQLGVMLGRAAAFYEGEITRWIERFTRAFEPLLMAAIGAIVGLIVILLYMPIFDLAGSFQ